MGHTPALSNPVGALARLLQLLLTSLLALPPHSPFLLSALNVHSGGLLFTTGGSWPGHRRCRQATAAAVSWQHPHIPTKEGVCVPFQP